MTNRRDFLKFAGSAAVAAMLTRVSIAQTAATKPNVLLIVADDMGWGDVSNGRQEPTYADSAILTPNIDALAAQGVKCNNAYSMPMCSPARAGLLTGKYPQRFGFFNNEDSHVGLPKDQLMLPELMKQAGYTTGLFGKWHVGTPEGMRPLDRGFDRFYGFLGAAHDYFKPNVGTDKDGAIYEGSFVWDQDKPVEKMKYLTDELTDQAIAFIDTAQKANKPFFAYVAYNAPHGPLQPKPEKLADFNRLPTQNKNRADARAVIESMDENIGRLMRELFLRGIDKNTLVIFASDNGGNEYERSDGQRTVTHNGGLRGRKFTVWEGGVRVPMILRMPDTLPEGAIYDKPVLLLDAFATAASLAGAALPPNSAVDSVNLIPFVAGKNPADPHAEIHLMRAPVDHGWAVRKGEWKLIQEDDSAMPPKGPAKNPAKIEGLYNVVTDPFEKNNLFDKHPEKVSELRALHDQFYKSCPPSIAKTKKAKEGRG